MARSGEVTQKLGATIAAAEMVSRHVAAMADTVRGQETAIEDVAHKAELLARQSEENTVAVREIRANTDQMKTLSELLQQSMQEFSLDGHR